MTLDEIAEEYGDNTRNLKEGLVSLKESIMESKRLRKELPKALKREAKDGS